MVRNIGLKEKKEGSECILKIIESRVSRRYLYAYIHSSIIHNSKKVEATQVSIDEWLSKCGIYVQ